MYKTKRKRWKNAKKKKKRQRNVFTVRIETQESRMLGGERRKRDMSRERAIMRRCVGGCQWAQERCVRLLPLRSAMYKLTLYKIPLRRTNWSRDISSVWAKASLPKYKIIESPKMCAISGIKIKIVNEKIITLIFLTNLISSNVTMHKSFLKIFWNMSNWLAYTALLFFLLGSIHTCWTSGRRASPPQPCNTLPISLRCSQASSRKPSDSHSTDVLV